MTTKATSFRARITQNSPQAKPLGEAEKAANAAIVAEGLSPRQMRLAWRVGRHMGISAVSEADAVRQLRERGIDPFDEAILFAANERAVASPNSRDGASRRAASPGAQPGQGAPQGRGVQPGQGGQPANAKNPPQPPQPKGAAQLPLRVQPQTKEVGMPQQSGSQAEMAQSNLRELRDIQRDIVRRRNIRMAQLFFRLSVFVFLPTLVAAYYYFVVATPLYKVNAEFVILAADSEGGGGGGGIGAMLGGGGGGATAQDSIGVQGYLESREALIRLNNDLNFKQVFSDPEIDPLQRLAPDASDEAAYALYSDRVTLGYDLTEGIIKLEVTAPDPEISQAFALALIGYAEERVDGLSERKRDDQLSTAREILEDALEARREAQLRLIELESDTSVPSATARLEALNGQLGSFEAELQEKRRQLALLLSNESPNQARVDGLQRDIASLEQAIVNINLLITESADGTSITARNVEIEAARADLETRELLLQSAIEALETATVEAGKQTRYLARAVEPVVPDSPSYPKPLEDTFVAFVVLFGIYLLVSVSASILQEQVNT